MLIFLTTLLGGLTPFLPDLIRYFTLKGDRKHELAVMEMRLKAGAQEHLWRMEEINTKADIAEAVAVHKPMTSFGVQILDKAHDAGLPVWAVLPIFWLFSLIDAVIMLVRPTITVAAVGFYMAYRWACVKAAQGVIRDGNVFSAIASTYTENDWAILFMVLGYWFGDRVRQKVKAGK